jgi:type II secretory pathway predicted ATPase ExeA
MYYEYWGLKKPPFDNVPDPSMYADCHASMENAIAETLFAIDEGGESIAVIIGDVGLGKTLSLRMIIDSLDQEKYKIALITNPSVTFLQLVKEIIGQLTGKRCDQKRKVDLLETFNKLLFDTIEEGKKVLICIDEANAISAANLESLRLLTNMQVDQMNLFTMVLAGQNELAQRLEHPKRANLFQRIGTYNRINKIESKKLLKTYVETRLKLAGGVKRILTEDAYDPLWEHSDHGVPRLVNKICKLCLKAGETNGFGFIDGEKVDMIGERFQRLTGPTIQKRKPRKIFEQAASEGQIEDTEHDQKETLAYHEKHEAEPVIEDLDSMGSPGPVEGPTAVDHEGLILEKESRLILEKESQPIPEKESQLILEKESQPIPEKESQPILEKVEADESPAGPEKTAATEDENAFEIELDVEDMKFIVNLPLHIIKQAQSSTRKHRVKLAGTMAAQALQQHPQFTSSHVSNPVHIWGELRDSVLKIFGEEDKFSFT